MSNYHSALQRQLASVSKKTMLTIVKNIKVFKAAVFNYLFGCFLKTQSQI